MVGQSASKILIADTSEARFQVYRRILTTQGFELRLVNDVDQILPVFLEFQPTLVIIDLNLCITQGCDVVGQIKDMNHAELFVPILLASDESENKLLKHALAQKADGFLNIPFSDALLLTKIYSLLRIRNLYAALKESRDKIHELHFKLEQEHKDAEKIYEKFVRPSSQDIVGFRSYISAASIFNGDLMLAKTQPSGDVIVLLGDFTGHGLSAAIGVIPVAEMFNGMVAKARSVPEILVEINAKLHKILPAHLFFGCAILQVSPSQHKARIFNCGMPDVLMVKPSDKRVKRFASQNLPLGVVDSKRLNLYPETISLSGNEVFYLLTDGIIESRNPAGEMFGYQRVEKALLHGKDGIDTLLEQASNFCEGQFFEDDVSIAQLQTDPILNRNYIDSLERLPKAANWKLSFEFDHLALKQMEHPIEGVVDTIMVIQPIPSHKERLFIILDELFNNALEHGVLKLDSSIKQQPDGFLKFLTMRQQGLEELKSGCIHIELSHKRLGNYEGELTIIMHDSGEGFDHHKRLTEPDQTVFYGRGILLTRSLCESLSYKGNGNSVNAIYRWNLRPELPEA